MVRIDVDLAGRRVGPQQPALDVDVERVPQVARGVVGRDVEHLEVGQVVFDLGALEDDEPELAEDLGDLGPSIRCSGGGCRGGSRGRAS